MAVLQLSVGGMGGRCLLFRTASIGESWVEAPSSNGAFVAKREEGRRCEGGEERERRRE